MSTTVLVAVDSAPYFGGAATTSYHLAGYLRERGIEAHHLSLVQPRNRERYRRVYGEDWPNPDGRPDTHVYESTKLGPGEHPALRDLVDRIDPGVILAKNDVTASLLSSLCPQRRIWFLPAGCKVLEETCVERGAPAAEVLAMLASERSRDPAAKPRRHSLEETERAALRACERVLCNSELMAGAFSALYPGFAPKIDDLVLWGGALSRRAIERHAIAPLPWHQRPTDVVLAASRWSRPVKGYALVRRLLPRIADLEVVVVGAIDDRSPGATFTGPLPQRQLFELLAAAKTVVSPSLYDASPNQLFEGAALGCNIVASPHCGNHRLAHPDLIVEQYDEAAFEAAVRRSLTAPLPGNHDLLRDAPLGVLADRLSSLGTS